MSRPQRLIASVRPVSRQPGLPFMRSRQARGTPLSRPEWSVFRGIAASGPRVLIQSTRTIRSLPQRRSGASQPRRATTHGMIPARTDCCPICTSRWARRPRTSQPCAVYRVPSRTNSAYAPKTLPRRPLRTRSSTPRSHRSHFQTAA
jgi:hypothetical protein